MRIKVLGWHHRSTDDPNVRMTDQQQKLVLLRGAVTLLYSRIRGINAAWNPLPGQVPSATILRSFKVIENTKEPELELIVAVQFQDTDGDRKEFPTRLRNLGAPLSIENYDPRWWPIDNEWGRLLNEDLGNVFLRSSFIPKSDEGDIDDLDYMSQQRHKSGDWAYMIPRVTQLPKVPDDTREVASTHEHVTSPTSGTTPATPAYASTNPHPVTPNPIPASIALTAYLSKDLKGETVMSLEPLRSAESAGIQTGISLVQQSGYSYLSWSSETLNSSSSGLIQLPLSKPRNTPVGSLGFTPSSGEAVVAKQTSAVVRLHAGMAKRIYSVTAERIGDWPEMPKPSPIIVRRKTTTGVYPAPPTSLITNVERLLNFEFLPESHDIYGVDGCTQKFVIHGKYEYALDQPIGASEEQNGIAGGSIFSSGVDTDKLDFIPVVCSPVLKTTFEESGIRDPSKVFVNGFIEPIPTP